MGELYLPKVETTIPTKCCKLYHKAIGVSGLHDSEIDIGLVFTQRVWESEFVYAH
jgi:hypothetical protein